MPKRFYALTLATGIALSGCGLIDPTYSRDVDRSPAEVIRALSDLDITRQPGSPGTDASLAGGVKPLFRVEKSDEAISWLVMSGDKVATKVTAKLSPINDGKGTRIYATAERGDAPDAFVSPAFRSKGVTMGLFSVAIDDELNKMYVAHRASPEFCQELARQLLSGGRDERSFASGIKAIMKVNAAEPEMRRQGCDTNQNAGEFRPVSSRMVEAADSAPVGSSPPTTDKEVSYEPGKPMINLDAE